MKMNAENHCPLLFVALTRVVQRIAMKPQRMQLGLSFDATPARAKGSVLHCHRHTQALRIPATALFFTKKMHHRNLGVSAGTTTDWSRLFRKGHNVNVLSAARFFLFGSRDVWFEIGLPLFLRVELGWKRELVGLILAGVCAARAPCTCFPDQRFRLVRSRID